MTDAREALLLLADRMQEYIDLRRPSPWDLDRKLREPYARVTEHLLINRESMSTGYVLLSETGAALMIDFGYDMFVGSIGGQERSSRLPWLASLPALERDFGVTRIEAVLPTHYHDDHVAGMPLLREVTGAEIWSPENVAPILADPWAFDLPCQWWDPIPSDRVLPFGEPIRWHEYEITVHPLPGHTLYAAAFELEVDGMRVLFTGDQQTNEGRHVDDMVLPNFQYRNLFRTTDYRDSAALYRRIAPGLLLSGHWSPRAFDEPLAEAMDALGERIVEVHAALSPELAFETDGVQARLVPYRSRVSPGATRAYTVQLVNPMAEEVEAVVEPVVPVGWRSDPRRVARVLAPGERTELEFAVTAGTEVARRERIAVDVSFGSLHLGQHAEAIIDVE